MLEESQPGDHVHGQSDQAHLTEQALVAVIDFIQSRRRNAACN